MESTTDPNLTENSLSSILYNNLRAGNYDLALNILKGKENKIYLKQNSLDIVPIISRVLEEEFCTSNTEICIEQMLEYIASIANPKEALLVFLEEIEIFRSKKQTRVMLKPLQVILLQQMSTNAKSYAFSWAFNTLNAHVSGLPLPSENNLAVKEREFLDADPVLKNLVDTLECVLDFYVVFYEKVLDKQLVWQDKNMTSTEYLSFFLLPLFHKPLTYVSIYVEDEDTKSRLYCICSSFVNMVSSLFSNPFKLLVFVKPKTKGVSKNNADLALEQLSFQADKEEQEETDLVSQLSLATFFYCILGQKIWASNLPCVYSHKHLFLSCLPSCIHLLTEKETFAIHKGLILLKALLKNLPAESLKQNCLEVLNHLDILKTLVQVMTLCESKECRILALDSLKLWFWKFDTAGRFHLISLSLSTVAHPGVLGVIIHELKENIKISLSDSKLLDSNFTGTKLNSVLCLACSLPSGEKTDLLEWSDKIMGALNLLLFICLYDTQNKSGFKSILPKIFKEFLQPLENGLRISKGHYELKLKDLCENKGKKSAKVEVGVNEDSFSGMLAEQEKEMIVQALNWFDTIQSVWARVNKLVSVHSEI